MGTDKLAAAFALLAAAVAEAERSLGETRLIGDQVIAYIASGHPVERIYADSGWGTARSSVFEAIATFQSALAGARSEYFRVLIDDEGMSISDVARLVGQPRQLVKRHYDEARALEAD